MVYKCIDVRKDRFGDTKLYILKDSKGNIVKLDRIETIGLIKGGGDCITNISLEPNGKLIIT